MPLMIVWSVLGLLLLFYMGQHVLVSEGSAPGPVMSFLSGVSDAVVFMGPTFVWLLLGLAVKVIIVAKYRGEPIRVTAGEATEWMKNA